MYVRNGRREKAEGREGKGSCILACLGDVLGIIFVRLTIIGLAGKPEERDDLH